MQPIRLFDRDSANTYINNNCPSLHKAFSSAFHYAVEADVFRVAFATTSACLWLDSDLVPTIHSKAIIQRQASSNATTLLFRWYGPRVTNAFFIAAESSKFFQRMRQQLDNYDFSNKQQDVREIFRSFGPGRYNAILNSGFQNEPTNSNNLDQHEAGALGCIDFINEHIALMLAPLFPLNYKTTKDAWQNSFKS